MRSAMVSREHGLEGMPGGLCRHGGSSRLCCFPSQPFGPWRKTANPPSIPWHIRPSSSSALQRCRKHHDGACERSAAGAAKPGRGATFRRKTALIQ